MCAQSCLPSSFPDPLPSPFSQLVLECLTSLSYRSGNLEAYLTEIARIVRRLIQADWTIITLCGGKTGQIVASSPDMDRGDTGFSVHGTLAAEVVQSGRSLVIEDSRQAPQPCKLANPYLAYLGIPLKFSTGEAIGTLCSLMRESRPFAEPEVKIVELFAERAATAIENYCLYQQQLQCNEQLSQEIVACSADLKLSQEKLIERERLAAIGEFTTMIVHEVRNPLTTIELGLKHAQRVLQSDTDRQRIDLALSESYRLNHLLTEILSYARPQELQLSRLSLAAFLDHVVMQVQELPEAIDRRINYIRAFPEVDIMADRDKLKQVFVNLFRNAFEAIAPQEIVRCSIRDSHKPDWICIQIHNGGSAIPPHLLPRLTTPFFSTKPSGTGLGLAISKRIIDSHGGELTIRSSCSGTTVSVHFPMLP